MTEIIILSILGILMAELYTRTKRPKLYALLNTSLGGIALAFVQAVSGGMIIIDSYNAAFSAILGLPGAVLVYAAKIV